MWLMDAPRSGCQSSFLPAMHCFENPAEVDGLLSLFQSRLRTVFSMRWNRVGMEAMRFDELSYSHRDF
jgi:hypothetical protein